MVNNGPLPNAERQRKRDAQPKPQGIGNLVSDDHKIGDMFDFDAFASGKQVTMCFGRRFPIGCMPGKPHVNLVAPLIDKNCLRFHKTLKLLSTPILDLKFAIGKSFNESRTFPTNQVLAELAIA
ncbi:hypothetical protein FGADI_10904 [Fusarium gaditjirri]|uniref:Uncharacterized protein n=1 Tax=Fusarium gaditjirri TaxID=282569 RepID=A0A8H4WR07_9HYPO|nr:hypothetical protein FGADI_10904 [Fusarium gaditjirri]